MQGEGQMIIAERSIAILIFDHVHLIDVAGPAEAFNEAHGFAPFTYDIQFFSVDDAPVHASCGLKLSPGISFNDVAKCDDLLITGGVGVDHLLYSAPLLKLIADWLDTHPTGRLISVCSGALLLVKAGILDGKTATTHWRRAQFAKDMGGNIKWDTEQIFTQNDRLFCSAGITSGIDLALHIIGMDCGRPAAIKIAQELVVPMQRSGSQSQHALLLRSHELASARLQPLVTSISENPSHVWSLEAMSNIVNLTPRTLCRQMRKDMGISPSKFVELVRLHYAVNLIETDASVEVVAMKSGFGSVQRLNRATQRHFGMSSQQLSSLVSTKMAHHIPL